MSLGEIINIIGVLIIASSIYFLILVITMKRNVKKVVKTFEKKNALSAETAISATKLNIRQQGMLERTIKRRDNRIHALKYLLNIGIVVMTTDMSYYLDKNKMVTLRENSNFITRLLIPNVVNS